MNITRARLYEAGEPLGECVTRRKHGGGYVCGGGGGGSSSSSTTTQNIDKRMAVGNDAIGASAENSTVTINTMDYDIVARALDSIDVSQASNGDGFTKLLSASEKMFERFFDKSEGLIGQTQSAVADAYGQAQLTKQGTIDNKTIVVLAVAGAAALVAINMGKRK